MLCTLIFAAALAFKGAQDAAVVDVTSAEQEGLWREGRQFGLRESDARRLWDDLLALG